MPNNNLNRTSRQQYEVDFDNRLRELLPFFWEFTIATNTRKDKFINLSEVIFKMLKNPNENLIALCEFIRDRLAFTGQVLSIVTLLNNKYDNIARLITITCLNTNFVEGIDIFNNDEVDPSPIELYNNGESIPTPITLFNNDEIDDPDSLSGISFIINIPATVTTSDQIIRALLAFYVIAPQQYLINRF